MSGKRQMTDGELIHDEIEKEISQCQCRNSFRAEMIDEGKYRVRISFEERVSLKLLPMVKVLSYVYVRRENIFTI